MTMYVEEELFRLKAEWPFLIRKTPSLPTFTWEELIEALLEKAPSPVEEMVIRGACAALLKMARFKPPEMVLREILMLTSSSFDLAFRHAPPTVPEPDMI